MSLTYLSLFSGIGGLDLGLDHAGMTCEGQVELDPFCRGVLARHWPKVPKHDDVRTAGAWWASRQAPPVDLVAGGFPCQPFSRSGRQLGIGDERWGWPWMRSVIDVVGPRYVLVENVAALVDDPRFADAFGTVLWDLSELGFDAEWEVVSACTVGAPHARNRLFLVAYPEGQGLEGLHASAPRVGVQPAPRNIWGQWAPEPGVARVADGIPARLVRDPIHAYGNAVVPAVAEFVGGLIVAHAAAVERAA